MKKIYVYRMTHIQNVPHILRNGIARPDSPNRDPSYIAIGSANLIEKRRRIRLFNGRSLGDYVPFYFGTKMPMLYVIQNGFNGVQKREPSEIVYCVSSVQKILELNLEFLFTNGHAVDALSEFYDRDRIRDIETLVDFEAVRERYWIKETDPDLKRRKEAEFLIFGDIPAEAILGYVVHSDASKATLQSFGMPEEKIVVKPEAYF